MLQFWQGWMFSSGPVSERIIVSNTAAFIGLILLLIAIGAVVHSYLKYH